MAALFTVRPITDRTPFRGAEHRKNSLFDVTYEQCLTLLERELWFLDAQRVVLECDVAEHQIRNDGQIRADASPASPCVRLAFDSNQGPLTYATDLFIRPSWKHGKRVMQKDWQHNLYAIAKGLEALRMVDRYGITARGEQYTGFKALPAGRAMPASHMTATEARTVLLGLAGYGDLVDDFDWSSQHTTAKVIRSAKARAHPDASTGSRALWDRLEEALKVLRLA